MYHLLQNVHTQHGHVGPPGEVLGGGVEGWGGGGVARYVSPVAECAYPAWPRRTAR